MFALYLVEEIVVPNLDGTVAWTDNLFFIVNGLSPGVSVVRTV